jgi:hypothetical protein
MDRKIDILWTDIQMDGQMDRQINKIESKYMVAAYLTLLWLDGQMDRQKGK